MPVVEVDVSFETQSSIKFRMFSTTGKVKLTTTSLWKTCGGRQVVVSADHGTCKLVDVQGTAHLSIFDVTDSYLASILGTPSHQTAFVVTKADIGILSKHSHVLTAF